MFANLRYGFHATHLVVEIRGHRSQIETQGKRKAPIKRREDCPPFCIRWRLKRLADGFDTPSGTQIYIPYFSQIAPSFPQKLGLRNSHNTSAQNRRNSHSTHFPRCGVGGGIHSFESIPRICLIASMVLRRSVSEIETGVMRPVGIR